MSPPPAQPAAATGPAESATEGITAAALNVYKKVAILRSAEDVITYEDAQTGQVKEIKDLGVEALSAATPLAKPKPKDDIPVPKIKEVTEYKTDVPADYRVPHAYVRHNKPEVTLEYVVDAEDEQWLQQNTKFGGNCGNNTNRLSLDDLEIMIDAMERATGFETVVTLDQAEGAILHRVPHLLHYYPTNKKAGVVTLRHVIQDVYQYWISKRGKLKRPLLRRFWPVTSTEDTNPHLVFRPREKEKYKLRKKRQNDMEAFRKLQQLRRDFEQLKNILQLVRQREDVHKLMVQLHMEDFQRCLYDCTDTSGTPRESNLSRTEIQQRLSVPTYFSGSAAHWKDVSNRNQQQFPSRAASAPGAHLKRRKTADQDSPKQGSSRPLIVAGQNHGEPAPNFLHPLASRESYTVNWDNAVPHVPTYIDSHAQSAQPFRHRPRLGRGGRICIDRLPRVPPPAETPIRPQTVYIAGNGIASSLVPKERLIDLLPPPLDYDALEQRMEHIALSALKEDYDRTVQQKSQMMYPPGAIADADESLGEAVLVPLEEWLDTDDPVWGEERYSVGPL